MRDELFDHLKHKLAETEIPDPGQGWQLMSSLLDATTRPKPVRVLYRWYAAAACLVLAGAAWAIVHEARTGMNPSPTAVAHKASDSPAVTAAPPVTVPETTNKDFGNATAPNEVATATAPATGGAPAAIRLSDARLSDARVNTAHTPSTSRVETNTGETRPSTVPASSDDAVASLSGMSAAAPSVTREPLKNALLHAQPLSSSLKTLAPTTGPLHPARHSRWGLDIGIGANFPGSMRSISVNNQNRFEPGLYPTVSARYRVTSRLSLKVGVSGPSPVAFTRTLSQKNLTVIDTLVNASYAAPVTASTTKIGRLLYMDIPLSASWMVVPHLNLVAGVQYSKLLSQQQDSRSTEYAASRLYSYAPAAATSQPTPMMQTIKGEEPSIRKSDIRYLVGAAYTWKRFSAEVEYQAGLQHSASQVDNQGNKIESHTSIAKMQIMYRLK